MAVTEPVSLEEAKRHLRVEFDDDDELISAYITAARVYAEGFLNRPLVEEEETPDEKNPMDETQGADETGQDAETQSGEESGQDDTSGQGDTSSGDEADGDDDAGGEGQDDGDGTSDGDTDTEPLVIKATWKQAILLAVATWYQNRENGAFPAAAQQLLWLDRYVPV